MTALRFTALLFLFVSHVVMGAQPENHHKPVRKKLTLSIEAEAWKGDLDGMIKRRTIRALVPFSKTFFYVERGRARGVSYDILSAFEAELNRKLKTRSLKVKVYFIPVGRDELIPMLSEGKGDLIVADMSITSERQRQVDFSVPMFSGIRELPVTGRRVPEMDAVSVLSGKEFFVRKTSSYYEHLIALNNQFLREGRPPVGIRLAPEELEAEDLLEMVNAGLVAGTVVDGYKAKMWSAVFPELRLHPEAAVSTGNSYAFLMRKQSPQLMAVVNEFVSTHNQNSTFGRSVINQYVMNPKFVKNALGDEERKRFGKVVDLFRKYGDKYDIDHLLMIAQGFQESNLNHAARSSVGAIGIMQIMPDTGRALKVGDIRQLDHNVEAGVKYIRKMIDDYFEHEPMTAFDKMLFAFASYNAGPGRVSRLRKEALKRGLDPNRWFNNVELVAAEKIGSETVGYVSNIFKYYTAYKLIEEQESERRQALEELK